MMTNVVGISGRAFLIDNTNGRWNRKSVKVVEQRNVSVSVPDPAPSRSVAADSVVLA